MSFAVEPFLPSLFARGSTRTAAYPPARARALLPLSLCRSWTDAAADARLWAAMMQSADNVKAKAVSLGQDVRDAPLYGNYALFTTPVEDIFGQSLPRLRGVKGRYDPRDVMGLAGGWKVPV